LDFQDFADFLAFFFLECVVEVFLTDFEVEVLEEACAVLLAVLAEASGVKASAAIKSIPNCTYRSLTTRKHHLMPEGPSYSSGCLSGSVGLPEMLSA
jgi:hypothetical protein